MAELPGAEYAPIVARDPYEGHRLASSDEIAAWLAVGNETIINSQTGIVVWRLACSDPVDMREIWRRAALALGATEEEALSYALVEQDEVEGGWSLNSCAWGSTRIFWEWSGPESRVDATAALCVAVWGP